jgi:hypothetical protein
MKMKTSKRRLRFVIDRTMSEKQTRASALANGEIEFTLVCPDGARTTGWAAPSAVAKAKKQLEAKGFTIELP